MPSVEINPVAETPSAAIINKSNKTATVVNSRGRCITVRKLTPLNKLRLVGVAGAELSENAQWMSVAALAWSVQSIDGDNIVHSTIREMEHTLDRLGDEGLDAAAQAYLTLIDPSEDAASIVAKAKN